MTINTYLGRILFKESGSSSIDSTAKICKEFTELYISIVYH